MLKYHMRYKGLPAGMNDTNEGTIARYISYVQEGRIDIDEMHTDVLDLFEYGSKTVHLFQISPSRLRSLPVAGLPNQVQRRSEARIAIEPRNPVINYSFVDSENVHVSFS